MPHGTHSIAPLPAAAAEPASHSLAEVIAALSRALDLTEGQPMGHAQRSCTIGLEVARRLGLGMEQRSSLLYGLLLKDAGCSSAAARMTELFAADDLRLKRDFKRIDWSERAAVMSFMVHSTAPDASPLARAGRLLRAVRCFAAEGQTIVETRCERGAQIVAKLGCPSDAAAAVRSLDEHWDGGGRPEGLAGEDIPLLARIAGLSQTVEIFHATDGWRGARDMVEQRRGRWFDPRIADAYLSIGHDDDMWTRLLDDDVATSLLVHDPAEAPTVADDDHLDRIAHAFAEVIDAKSPYTGRHSSGVARYAGAIAETVGMEPATVRVLRRAALLHDIGKLGISNTVLDKRARLTDDEFAAMRLHTVHTQRILEGVSAFSDIALVAASHHERLDGRGYHRGVGADMLPPFARILMVADIYEALTADRPYRGPMTPSEALAILWEDAGRGPDPHYIDALGSVVG